MKIALFLVLLLVTGPLWADCSANYAGLAAINEVSDDEDFIEIKVLSSAVDASIYDNWTLEFCSREGNGNGNNNVAVTCSGKLSLSLADDNSYPWLVMNSEDLGGKPVDLRALEVRLNDADDDTIDYLRVADLDDDEAVQEVSNLEESGCDIVTEVDSGGGNSGKLTKRQPDGTGDYSLSAGGSGGDETEGASNEGGVNSVFVNINNVPVERGNTAVLTVALESELDSADVTVFYETRDGTATSSADPVKDYESRSGSFTIPAGSLTSTVEVPTLDNGEQTEEAFRVVLLRISSSAEVALRSQIGIVTLTPAQELVDHFEIVHDGTGLTCQPEEITIRACNDPDCSQSFPDPVQVTMTPSGWVDGDTFSFTGDTTRFLGVTTPITVTLGVASSDPDASAAPRTLCDNGTGTLSATNCDMTFADSGFVIDVPDHVAGEQVSGTVTAVRKGNETERCVPGFSGESKDVSFWSQYSNPSTGTLAVSIDSTSIDGASPGTLIKTLSFDSNGVATIEVRYADVGQMGLNARHEGSGDSEGLVMTGLGSFIARPAYFTLEIDGNPEASSVADNNVFVAAGAAFPITISSRNISDEITPNFGQESDPEGVDLNASLVAPVDGELPALAGTFGAFGEDCDGAASQQGAACGRFNWPEVGIISINPVLASGAYLATEAVTGNAVANVGRFVPARFDMKIIDDGTVEPYCSVANSFAYSGQELGWSTGIEPLIEVRALAEAGTITRNYTSGSFLRLDSSGVQRVASATDETAVGTEGVLLPVSTSLDPLLRSVESAGVLRFVFSDADSVRYDKRSTTEVAPFVPDYRVAIERVTDQDSVTSTQPALSLQPGFGFEMRFGRLVLDNAFGPETLPLIIPMRAEYFDGDRFITNSDESCRIFTLPDDTTLDFSGSALTADDTDVGTVNGGQLVGGRVMEADRLMLSAPGEGTSETPGNRGIAVELDVPVWLRYFWQQGLPDTLVNPTALATFGVYRGNDRIIYWREVR